MAVYTDVSDEELEQFVAGYDIGEVLSCKGIAEGVENSNFLLSTSQGQYILTLYEKRVNPDDLPFFLGLMEHLADRGVQCPRPIHARDGAALKTLSSRPAAIISFLTGLGPKRIQPFHCAGLGRALAEMHVAGADFTIRRENALSVTSWRALLDSCNGRGEEVVPGITKKLGTELDFLEANWPAGLPAGVIHADLFKDNVFFRGEELSGLIDFYFACNDQFAYDVAICLNAWCFESDLSFNITKAKRMLDAYGRVRGFSADELQALPVLARGSAMRFLLTRLYDWLNTPADALVTPHDPLEFLARLEFHQSVTGPGAYGL